MKNRNLCLLVFGVLAAVFWWPVKVLAVTQSDATTGGVDVGPYHISSIPILPTWEIALANVLNTALWAAGILAFAYLIYAGIKYITAGGGDGAEQAKKTIINVIIGIVVIFLSLAILNFVIRAVQNGPPASGTTNDTGGSTNAGNTANNTNNQGALTDAGKVYPDPGSGANSSTDDASIPAAAGYTALEKCAIKFESNKSQDEVACQSAITFANSALGIDPYRKLALATKVNANYILEAEGSNFDNTKKAMDDALAKCPGDSLFTAMQNTVNNGMQMKLADSNPSLQYFNAQLDIDSSLSCKKS